jgi:surface polysaccharide O-acyltransferase-like enzyme
VDLIRVIAIVSVILLHATNILTNQVASPSILRWWTIDIYQSIGRLGVPLFLMLSGVLLLVPSKKDEDITFFLKKRLNRIGLPFIFWSIIYFLWAFYVENQPVTQEFIMNGIFRGPYVTFWYIYMLFGLFLITPILRVMVAHFTDKLYKYFLYLWFIGFMLTPLINILSNGPNLVSEYFFIIPIYVGYFVIGNYLVNVQVRRRTLAVLTILGVTLSAIGTSILAMYLEGGAIYFFQEYLSPTIIIASLSLFVLLISYKPKDKPQTEKPSWKQHIIHEISKNTLAIYFLHIIIIYLLQDYVFSGFALTGNAVNSIISIPLITALTLGICLIIIWSLKKIPGLRKLIG